MRVFATLLRRELGTYFMSLTGYVVIATVLLLLGVSFLDLLGKLNSDATSAPLTELFYVTLYFWLVVLLTAPVITMRTFALERFSGTYETLMTAPVSDLQVVLAKFFGALTFFTICWLPLLGYVVLLQRYTQVTAAVDLGTLGSTFLGVLLIGSVYMAMGCFASSVTRSQLIAAALSYGFGLTLFLLSLRSMVAMPPQGWEGKVFAHISMVDHMREFARGDIDTRWVVYYLSLTFVFLFLTLRVVESRRWK